MHIWPLSFLLLVYLMLDSCNDSLVLAVLFAQCSFDFFVFFLKRKDIYLVEEKSWREGKKVNKS